MKILFDHFTVDDSPGLSDGAIAGLVIGSVSIVFLLLILLIALIVIVRRCRHGKPLARLAPLDRDREAIPLGNSDRYGYGYPLADYPSDMDLGPKRRPGYSDGAYYSEVILLNMISWHNHIHVTEYITLQINVLCMYVCQKYTGSK